MAVVKVGTFNVLDLAVAGQPLYDDEPVYSDQEFDHKGRLDQRAAAANRRRASGG